MANARSFVVHSFLMASATELGASLCRSELASSFDLAGARAGPEVAVVAVADMTFLYDEVSGHEGEKVRLVRTGW